MCTSIEMTAKNGEVFWGRTMDLSLPMFGELGGGARSVITSFPAGVKIKSQLKSWSALYAVMGIGIRGTSILYDGINEAGLAGDLQVLFETTAASRTEIDQRNQIPVMNAEFVTYILTHYQSVAEIRQNYHQFAVLAESMVVHGKTVTTPIHYNFVDPSGDSVVLEATDRGSFKLYDSVGVMTNSPEYDWHVTNLRNYIGLDKWNLRHRRRYREGQVLKPLDAGIGYGLASLPGSYTSVDRFIRSFMITNMMDEFEAKDGVNQLYAAFHSVIIPQGVERNSENNTASEHTRYWVGYDLEQRRLYVQPSVGLAFTSKQLDPLTADIEIEEINTGNYFDQR